MNGFRIEGTTRKRLCALATETYPSECCAALFTKDGYTIEEFCVLSNRSTGSGHYSVDPLELYECEKTYRQKGYEIMGIFHSHPDAPATVSDEDAENMIPGIPYLIASVTKEGCRMMRLWKKEAEGES